MIVTQTQSAPSEMALTEAGWKRLSGELPALREQRAAKVASYKDLARQAEPGDYGLHALQAEVSSLDQRLTQYEDLLARARLIDLADGPPDVVRFGSRVVVRWEDGAEERYVVVTPPELELRSGRISCQSPVGRAILGCRPGERVAVQTPAGSLDLQVLSVAQDDSADDGGVADAAA
jgi:transcription elongation GreA/GreB family factor